MCIRSMIDWLIGFIALCFPEPACAMSALAFEHNFARKKAHARCGVEPFVANYVARWLWLCGDVAM